MKEASDVMLNQVPTVLPARRYSRAEARGKKSSTPANARTNPQIRFCGRQTAPVYRSPRSLTAPGIVRGLSRHFVNAGERHGYLALVSRRFRERDAKEASGRARPLNESLHRPSLHVQRSHRFLVAPRPALRPHEQQPAGDHHRLQHPRHDLPDADPNRRAADFQLRFLHGPASLPVWRARRFGIRSCDSPDQVPMVALAVSVGIF